MGPAQMSLAPYASAPGAPGAPVGNMACTPFPSGSGPGPPGTYPQANGSHPPAPIWQPPVEIVDGVTVNFEPPRLGLQNTNNTCYMNSVLQSLFMTSSFVKRIFTFRLTLKNKP